MDIPRASSFSSSSSSSSSVVVGDHRNSVKEASVDEAFYRNKMALFASSFWLFLTNSLVLLISFISRHLFGIRIGDDSGQKRIGADHDDNASLLKGTRSVEPLFEMMMMQPDIINGDTFEEKEDSGFTFKFQYQIPNSSPVISEQNPLPPVPKEKEPSPTASIHSYRFMSGQDIGVFMEDPEAKTFRIRESYVDQNMFHSGDTNSFLSLNCKQESVEDNKHGSSNIINKLTDYEGGELLGGRPLEGQIKPDANSLLKVEGDRASRFLSEELLGFDLDTKSPIDPDDNIVKHQVVVPEDIEKKEKELDNDPPPADGKKASVQVAKHAKVDRISMLPTLKDENFHSNKPLQQEKIKRSDTIPSRKGSNTRKSGKTRRKYAAKFLSEEFFGFNSDCESLCESDGYSVKDLVVENSDIELKTDSSLSAKNVKRASQRAAKIGSLNSSKKQPTRKAENLQGTKPLKQEKIIHSDRDILTQTEKENGASFLTEEFSGLDSDSESISESDGYSVKDLVADSDDFLSERDFDGSENVSASTEDSMIEVSKDIRRLKEAQLQYLQRCAAESASSNSEFQYTDNQSKSSKLYFDVFSESLDLDENSSASNFSNPGADQEKLNQDITENSQVGNFDETHLPQSGFLHLEFTDSSDDELVYPIKNNFSSLKSFDDLVNKSMENDDFSEKEAENVKLDASTDGISRPSSVQVDSSFTGTDVNDQSQKPEYESETKAQEEVKENSEEKELKDLDNEDYDELESLWEHQDLIEQLRMELKRVKTIGLPTILEESETPKTVEDLKPWKIDKKFMHEDPMDELHKFYKSYHERMRKLDILNYQKMYAIGFLQRKDPLQSIASQKSLIPTITSILSHSFRPLRGKLNTNSSESFIKELRAELELVYVGQTCLSWEFLRWQYEKARELPESDPYRDHHYNHVAGEFQQFQVLLQRFIENESFQGPRLPSYVRNRCVLRNLLQVPVIREDSLKDKREDQRKGNYIVTSEMLEDIMEESIRIFWEFVKADKDETPGILKALKATHAELQDPSDFELIVNIQSDLQKKEKKLKDILRTGNCIIKKFKKPKEDRTNQDLFFSQVDLKLVARVLRMSRITTDQLVWCHKKLDGIMFVDRKIYRESSFLQFPC